MQSGCEIIESYQPGFQVPSPQSLAHRTTKSFANGKFHKRHIDQLRTRSLDTLEDTSHKYLDFPNEQPSPQSLAHGTTKSFANGKFHKRHIDQLRTRSLDTLEDTSHKYLDFPNEQSDPQENQPTPPALSRRYPQRENRRPPDRLTY